MEKLKVCRICLMMDVKMYDIQSYPLDTYFEPILGINPLSEMELPPYACFECAALVKKYYGFRDRCLKGQVTLYGILHTKGKITASDIQEVNRPSLHLASHLTTQVTSELNVTHHVFIDPEVFEIKEEPVDAQIPKFTLEIGCVKEEDCVEDLGIPSPLYQQSSDDEPLSLHKSSKEKKGKKNKKKAKKEKRSKVEQFSIEQLEDIQVAEDISSFPDEIAEFIQPKPKRGRPRKAEAAPPKAKVTKPRRTHNTGGVLDDDIDLEEYVTVIKLSMEEQMEEISKRRQSSNYLNAPYRCELCFKGFIDTLAWDHHLGKHDPKAGDIECPVCRFRFKTKRTLQKHVTNHEKKYACKSCPYVSKTATQAKQHQRWHKGVTYKCQHCDEVSTKWTSYLSHVRIKHPSEFICGVCGYSFVSKLGLAMHKTMMHKDVMEKSRAGAVETGPYCAECDVRFVGDEPWKRHLVTSAKHAHAAHFKQGCRACGATFASSEELRVHHRREHARRRPKNYGRKPPAARWPQPCEHCAEEIADARAHWAHFRRAHPDQVYPIQKNHVCDICGKSFRGNAFLVYHKRTHFEERAFKCATCGKAFHNRTNLNMHEKTHSDARPYPCTVCFKAFKGKGALDRHFRCHTGVKPYSCEVCGKAFGQSNSRKLHVRTVHLKQPAPYVSRARQERRNKQKPPSPPFVY